MKFIKPDWPAPTNIKAFTTTKQGWGNAPYSREIITAGENHELKELLQLPGDPVWINQQHGTVAVEAIHPNRDKIADASFTSRSQHICVVTTADCLPVLICDQSGLRVAAIHAGWRGLAAGIIESTLAKLAIPADKTLVWLGPAIGPEKFEVGKDVYDAFVSKHTAALDAFKQTSQDKWHADLYALARLRLTLQGISQIFGGNFCTYQQEDYFFSYRRDGKETGRMASLIWID